MITFEELPPVMAKRARWAREQILSNNGVIETVCPKCHKAVEKISREES